MDKRIKELEKLEKAVNQAERFKTSVLEFFQNKYEDADNKKKRCDTFGGKCRARCARKCTTSYSSWLVGSRTRSSQRGVLILHPPIIILITR